LEKDVYIIAGPSSCDLAIKTAKVLQDIADLVPVDFQIFSDGESRIKINRNTRKKYCIIIQSTYPPVDRHLLQMLMMIKKCNDENALGVCSVIPYMAYARQDKVFVEGEVVTIGVIAKLLEAVGTNSLITVDIHSMQALSYFTVDAQNISSVPLLANYAANNMKLSLPIVISPDKGGFKRAEEFARILKTDMIALNKYRNKNTGQVTIDEKLDSDITNRDVILVDDMISSGGSIIKACEVLKKNKCRKIYAMCAHALLVGDALQRIKDIGIVEDIIATNSIPGQCAKVDLSPILSHAIRKIIDSWKHWREKEAKQEKLTK
jgi:ribose-phosphate pyrophosphokinase